MTGDEDRVNADANRRLRAIHALNELRFLTTCRCEPAWTERGRHETHCAWDYREDVDTLAHALGVGQ